MAVTDPPHTAISSCSGYIYQGKIALMHCLKLFENLGAQAKELSLEIESLDDFAIKNGDGSYRSMHQVKAKKEQRFSAYRAAIVKQQRDSQNHAGIGVYFHVAANIEDTPDNFAATFNPVQFYSYRNEQGASQNSCPLNCVDNWNNEQLKKTYQALGQPDFKHTDEEYLNKTRQHLEDLVIKHIICVHHKIIECKKSGVTDRHIAQLSNIPLNIFFEAITETDFNNVDSEDYFHGILIKKAGEYFHEFCLEQVELGEFTEDDDKLYILNGYLAIINTLNVSELKKFVQSIMPHREASFNTIPDLIDSTFDREDFKNGLLQVFKNLIESQINSQSLSLPIFYWNKDSILFYPTAIDTHKRNERMLCQKIVQTSLSSEIDVLYEAGKLVNQGITNESIFVSSAIGSFQENDEQDPYRHNKINEVKKVSLISLDDAMEELND